MATTSPEKPATMTPTKQGKGLRFWLIFLALCVSLFLSALEFTATANALPVIINDLHGEEFAWIGTAYALASTAFLPMSGGFAEIFGRRATTIGGILVFALGSALCGAAQSMSWLIAARTVQGVGGGIIISVSSIVVSDMVPLAERGSYNGLIGLTWAFAVAIGPLIGGALASGGDWRWLFYLNLPVCGVALGLVVFFMKFPTPKGTWKQKLAAMDWIGNALVVSSSTSLVIALTWGGVRYDWDSGRVLAPLILGLLGLIAWLLYEIYLASHPLVPKVLLGNRTTVSGYAQVFLNSLVVTGWTYYIPVFYQACKGASAIGSGVDMFGVTLVVGPFVVFGGVSVTILKRYRSQLWFAWVLSVVGAGIFSTVDNTSSRGKAIGLPAVGAAGSGILFATTYFPVLSPLPVSENAHALALFAFLRSFGQIWGVAIGSAILNNQLSKKIPREILSTVSGGAELIYSIIPEIPHLQQPLKSQVEAAFADSLRPVWYTFLGILGLGFLTSLLMKDVPMHNYTDEKWNLQASETEKQADAERGSTATSHENN